MARSFLYPAMLVSCFSAAYGNANETSKAVEEKEVEETVVLGVKRDADYTIITESAEKLIETAGAMGDPLGAVFALPGVAYSESQAPAVRGSSPDDNAFVVDFMPASYIFHEFGVSVFSEHILHDFHMYAAGFGPEYSDVTGAVFDVTLRQPKNQDISTILDLSMLRSGIFIEGAVTERSAFYLSARRMVLEHFVSADDLSDDGIEVKKVPSDTDYQLKYSWEITDTHRLSFSANGAMDHVEAQLTEEADFVKSNPDFEGHAKLEEKYAGAGLLWEYFGENGTEWKLGKNYLHEEDNTYWGDAYSVESDGKQQTLKALLSVPFGNQFRLRIGGQHAEHDWNYKLDSLLFVCTEFDPDCNLNRKGRLREDIDAKVNEMAYYVDGSWMPTDSLAFDLGVQRQTNDYTDESFTNPRVAAHWQVLDSTRLSIKAGRYNRFPDLDTVLEETGNPDIKSPTADHFTLGLKQDLARGWSFSVEGYYKELKDLPRSLGDDEPNSNLRYVNETEGKARGVELMVNKNRTGKWWGWMTLSYSKSDRTNLYTQETKEYFLDTPLIFNLVANYQVTSRLNLGWRWSIRSGKAYTPITGVQENPWFEDSVLPEYGDPYSDRLPYYNRLDFRLQWDTTTFGYESALIFDLINALNYENVSSRDLDYDKVEKAGDQVQTVDTVDIGIQPALTYRITF